MTYSWNIYYTETKSNNHKVTICIPFDYHGKIRTQDSEEEAKERMIRTLDFQRKEKYALTVYLKTNEVPKAIGWASMREVSSGIYADMGIAIGPDFVGKGYGKQILNALCDEARNQGAKEFHCSCREKNLASRGLQDACGFKFDYRSEEKTDPRTGEIYVVVNAKKDLQYVV